MNPFSHVSHISNPEFWNKKTVLVAGGTGFLGGWIVRRLLDHGARVIALIRKPRPGSHFYLRGYDRKAEVVIGDIADIGLVRDIFKKNPDISVFFHAAYGGDVNTVLKEPLECFRAAAQSTWEILDLLRLEYPECISVISSSDKAYGNQSLPYRETSPLMPMHPYEVAKSSQDLAAQSYGKTYGLPVAVTRCGNYYGAYDFNFSRLIPGVMKDLAEGRQPVLRSNGRFTRDFLYIEDAAEVQLMLAERLAEDPSLYGEAFNFSYEVELEVIDIVRRLAELTGQAIEPVVNNSVRAEIPHMRLSTDKAASRLGWKPRFSFDEGLKRSVKWYLEHFRKNAAAYLVGHFSFVGKASELMICGI